MSPPCRDIMGVAVTAATAAEMTAALDRRRGESVRTRLAFLNAHTSNLAAADPAFRAMLGDFVVLNDGVGIDIASRWLHGARFPENLNGTDFVPAYLQATARPARLFLLGAADAVARQVAASGADIVLVALGNPAQERFIAAHFETLGCDLAIGVGALFDFLAGRVRRAPGWLRRIRAEWVYRLWLEPGRLWRRYLLGNSQFLWRLLWTRRRAAEAR
jgi:UDP-N-acetyl-D-mannosaminuronic acid transferase (WecB/TagA/CpsF family)